MPGVKVGDLAITRAPRNSGIIVEILSVAPAGAFTLPNGVPHDPPVEHPSWVVKLIGTSMRCRYSGGESKVVSIGVAADRYLFPLPGDEKSEDERSAVTVGDNQ